MGNMKKALRLGTVPRRLFGLLGDDEVSESESFEGDIVQASLPEKQLIVLEWQPKEDKLVRRFSGRLESLSVYYVAGSDFTPFFKDAFGVLGPFDKVKVLWKDWTGSVALEVPAGTVDVVLISSKASVDLGQELLQKAVVESARALKSNGLLLFFLPTGYDGGLQGLEAYFDIQDTRVSKEGDLEALFLVPNGKLAPDPAGAPRVVRRRRRRKAE